jgi:adenylate cyclase
LHRAPSSITIDDPQFAEFFAWMTEAGLSGLTETALLAGFCDRASGLGLPLARATVLIDTLHPATGLDLAA